MIVCLCGCAEIDHALGEGICSCGCPAFRPYRRYSEADELHDRQHDGVAEEFLRTHALRIEIMGDHVWTLLPELDDLPGPEQGKDVDSTPPA
ncbi:MAG: hypothetical protein ACRDJU_01080 [Actinomycetota bacterium]